MRLALAYAAQRGIASVKLDATPAGRPLYESLGFVAEAEFERWQGVARPGPSPSPPFMHGDSRRAMSALDRSAYGVDRLRVLDLLAAESSSGPVVVETLEEFPVGYAIARRGRTASYIGPLVATTAIEQLLDAMLARLAGKEVCLDLHRGSLLEPHVLAERGLAKQRDLTRMYLGPQSDAGTAPSICASAGPEFG